MKQRKQKKEKLPPSANAVTLPLMSSDPQAIQRVNEDGDPSLDDVIEARDWVIHNKK
ncbi:MAG: hypothetical protein Q8865_11160 [Bacillota bacterium]|nr:hypothetical protein [Bacillota bacterium]